MVVKKTLSSVTRGANLLNPKPNLQYIVAAVVAVGVLMLVWKGGQMLFDRFTLLGQTYNPYAEKPDYKAALGIV